MPICCEYCGSEISTSLGCTCQYKHASPLIPKIEIKGMTLSDWVLKTCQVEDKLRIVCGVDGECVLTMLYNERTNQIYVVGENK